MEWDSIFMSWKFRKRGRELRNMISDLAKKFPNKEKYGSTDQHHLNDSLTINHNLK